MSEINTGKTKIYKTIKTDKYMSYISKNKIQKRLIVIFNENNISLEYLSESFLEEIVKELLDILFYKQINQVEKYEILEEEKNYEKVKEVLYEI